MGMKKRIKEEDDRMIRKQTFTKKDHKQHPKNHLVKKAEIAPNSGFQEEPTMGLGGGGGGGEGGGAQQSTHDLLIICTIARSSFIEISWSAILRNYLNSYVRNLLLTTHKLILRRK
jgi:hypothetical protein